MQRRSRRPGFGIFLALAALAACDQLDPDATSVTSPVFQSALILTSSAPSIPADGFSRVGLIAQISGDADKRTVKFKTNVGTLVGSTATGSLELTVEADSTGQARAQLQSAAIIGPALVEASVIDTADNNKPLIVKTITVDFTPVDSSDVIRIGTAASTGQADGESRIAVFADIAADIPTDKRTVTFATSLGTFTIEEAIPGGSNRATVDLTSPATVGTARVTATVNGFSAETTIEFGPALPDSIVLTLSPTSLTQGSNSTSTVSATLRRFAGRGTVSDNLQMDYSAVVSGTSQSLALVFSEQGLASGQAASAKVGLGNETFTGTATIRARVVGGSVVGEADLVIAPAG